MRAYKYRIYPNGEQRKQIESHFGCVRHVYNWALGEKERSYKETGKSISKKTLQEKLVASKKTDKLWLKEVNSQSLLASLFHLDTAFSHFFSKRGRFPKKKKKYSGWQSFHCPQHVKVDYEKGKISLPKIGGVKAKLHRGFEGEVKTVVVKRTPSGHYYASVLVDDGMSEVKPAPIEAERTLGLDVGITHFLTESTGKKVENPKFLKKDLEALGEEQKKGSRKVRGSGNRARQRRKIARLHERISNRRGNFIHQETAKLVVKNHATSFVVEDLHIKGMIKNRRLSRAIQDCGWRFFFSTLEYKCRWKGKNLIQIARFMPSSKRCSQCGHVMEILPLHIREWRCPVCHAQHDRDVCGAENIRYYGLADALGYSACVKSPPVAKPVRAGTTARGTEISRYGSQEAPTRVALAT